MCDRNKVSQIKTTDISTPPAVSSGLLGAKCLDTKPQTTICMVGQYAISMILGQLLRKRKK